MNRLALVLAAVLSSYLVACAGETAEETVAPPAIAAEEAPAADLEAKPHAAQAPVARENDVVGQSDEGAFVERHLDGLRLPIPTPKPGLDVTQ